MKETGDEPKGFPSSIHAHVHALRHMRTSTHAHLGVRQVKVGVESGVAAVEVRLPLVEIGPLNGGLRAPNHGHGGVIGGGGLQEFRLAVDEALQQVVRGKPKQGKFKVGKKKKINQLGKASKEYNKKQNIKACALITEQGNTTKTLSDASTCCAVSFHLVYLPLLFFGGEFQFRRPDSHEHRQRGTRYYGPNGAHFEVLEPARVVVAHADVLVLEQPNEHFGQQVRVRGHLQGHVCLVGPFRAAVRRHQSGVGSRAHDFLGADYYHLRLAARLGVHRRVALEFTPAFFIVFVFVVGDRATRARLAHRSKARAIAEPAAAALAGEAAKVLLVDQNSGGREGDHEQVVDDDAEGGVDSKRADGHDGGDGRADERHRSGERRVEDRLHGPRVAGGQAAVVPIVQVFVGEPWHVELGLPPPVDHHEQVIRADAQHQKDHQ